MIKFILPKMIFKFERWKWNPEYRIYVSTMGNFKDEYKDNLPIKIGFGGYVFVKTRCGYMRAHRVVMFTWRPCPGAEKLTVDHLNHNKRDNSIYNLEWVTKEENLRRAEEDLLTETYPDNIELYKDKIKYYRAGRNKFLKIDDAIDFCIKVTGNHSEEINRTKIEKHINKAINKGNKYCGLNWRYS